MIIHDARPWADRTLARLDAEPGSALAIALSIPGALWTIGARLKRVVAPDIQLPGTIPSLGVGNLRVGGSGKTPVVEDLGSRLVAEGERVAVLTRGYRAGGGGDEPAWLEGAGLQVFADADRRRSYARAEAAGATRMVLDDALQTRFRPRWTVAIVLDRDLLRPPRVLPAGPAREGISGLDRADLLLVRRENPDLTNIPQGALGFRLAPVGLVDGTGSSVELPSGPALLLSGLARPESFEADARAAGVEIAGTWREADHWAPRADAGGSIASFASQCGAGWVLVPEKNIRRAEALELGMPLVALRSRVEWDEGADPMVWLRDHGIAV